MTPLAQITSIILPLQPIMAGGGHVQIVMTHTDSAYPGAGKFDAGATNTLIITNGGPSLCSDLELSQLEQTSEGAPALDDISYQYRDTMEYSGTVNGVSQTEDFYTYPNPTTFFTEFLRDTTGYKSKKFPVNVWCVLYENDGTTLREISYIGHLDPNYKPQSGQLISSHMTATEALNDGSLRTLKTTEISLSKTAFQCALNIIGSGDCEMGAGYCGYMYTPPSVEVQGGTSSGVFAAGTTNPWLMQATLHQHDYDGKIFNNVENFLSGRTSQWPNQALPWSKTDWFGPTGSWWINLGTLISKIANSQGQIYSNDASVTSGSNVLTSASAQFSSTLVGKVIHFSLPLSGGSASAYIYAATATTVTLSSTYPTLTPYNFTNTDSNLFWWIEGTADQQLLFDVNGQMGSSSPLYLNSLRIFQQQPDATHFCYPINTSGPPLPKDIHISVNGFLGAHPYDGAQWNTPIAFNANDTEDIVLQKICNFLGCEYEIIPDQTTGQATLTLKPLAQPSAVSFPDWEPIGDFTEQEPSSSALSVTVNNPGVGPVIMAPVSSDTNAQNYIVPIRLHSWASAVQQTSDMSMFGRIPITVTFSGSKLIIGTGIGNNVTVAEGGLSFDASLLATDQADHCFKVVWYDQNNSPQKNDECWKGLSFAMFRDASNTNVMYPTTGGWNTPLQNGSFNGGWNGSTSATAAFYALGYQYAPSETPDANESNTDRANSVDYQATLLATYKVPSSTTVLQRDYQGTQDGSGLLSTINTGLTASWYYDGAMRTFKIIALPRYILSDVTTGLQWEEIASSDFPLLGSIPYGVQPNSNNSGSAGSPGSGYAGGNSSSFGSFQPNSNVDITGTGTIALPTMDFSYECTDNATTGITLPTANPPQTIMISNFTSADFSTGDLLIPQNKTWTLKKNKSTIQTDPALPAGWSWFNS